MKTIKGNLILKKDTIFNEDLKVEGNISGYFDLKVIGDINCRNINCWSIDCWNIDCRNIDCRNIDCWSIDCRDINCWNIDCRNIDCWGIDCRNIDCWSIDCRNINCWGIDCRNIIYCDKIKCKKEIKARMLIKDRYELKQKVWK